MSTFTGSWVAKFQKKMEKWGYKTTEDPEDFGC
jgi:hypothetical protein